MSDLNENNESPLGGMLDGASADAKKMLAKMMLQMMLGADDLKIIGEVGIDWGELKGIDENLKSADDKMKEASAPYRIINLGDSHFYVMASVIPLITKAFALGQESPATEE